MAHSLVNRLHTYGNATHGVFWAGFSGWAVRVVQLSGGPPLVVLTCHKSCPLYSLVFRVRCISSVNHAHWVSFPHTSYQIGQNPSYWSTLISDLVKCFRRGYSLQAAKCTNRYPTERETSEVTEC